MLSLLGCGQGQQGNGGSFDTDYQAILDYANVQGYTLPNNAQKEKQNTLLISLKSVGAWDKLDAFSVFATNGDSDFALIDWKRLTQYTAVNSPTFITNQGFAGDGISAYISTNYNGDNLYNKLFTNQTNVSSGLYVYTEPSNIGAYIWGVIVSPQYRLQLNGGLSRYVGSRFSTNFSGVGLFSVHRYYNPTDLEYFVFKDSTDITIPAAVNSYIDALGGDIDLFRQNGYSDATLSIHYEGSALDNEIVGFSDAINTYINSL